MPNQFTVTYLIIMVAVAAVLLALLNTAQKAVLRELADVLYKENNPRKYLNMLESRFLPLVLRKGTRALLELDGWLALGQPEEVAECFHRLETLSLRPAEKLDYEQKRLSYAVSAGDKEDAARCLNLLRELLEKEKSPRLRAILEDAKLLTGIYLDHNTSLIPKLLELEKKQSGGMQGITRYRLAKLYWYAGQKDKAEPLLSLAEKDLRGTYWQKIVEAAKADHSVLETR